MITPFNYPQQMCIDRMELLTTKGQLTFKSTVQLYNKSIVRYLVKNGKRGYNCFETFQHIIFPGFILNFVCILKMPSLVTSVTRFCEISPLWQVFDSLFLFLAKC